MALQSYSKKEKEGKSGVPGSEEGGRPPEEQEAEELLQRQLWSQP